MFLIQDYIRGLYLLVYAMIINPYMETFININKKKYKNHTVHLLKYFESVWDHIVYYVSLTKKSSQYEK